MINLASCKQMKRGVLFLAHVVAVATIVVAGAASASTAADNLGAAQSGRTHSAARHKNPNYHADQANYFGNWGFAPGGYYWDPNYMWRRSRGFWDTNAPACPFRSC
jgi:hypothetical protein